MLSERGSGRVSDKTPQGPMKQSAVRKDKQITSPAGRTPSVQVPLAQNPNGICIGGENSGSATVNNFAPPEAHLSWHEVDAVQPRMPRRREAHVDVQQQ